MSVVSNIKGSVKSQSAYFADNLEVIAYKNLQMTIISAFLISIAYTLFYVIAGLLRKAVVAKPYYFIALVPFILLGIVAFIQIKKKNYKIRTASIIATFQYLLAILFGVILSVFVRNDKNAIYFPLLLLFAPNIFYLRFIPMIVLNTMGFGVFAALVMTFKIEAVRNQDLWEAFIALVLSYAEMYFLIDKRVSASRMNEEFKASSILDQLTGLYNKQTFLKMANIFIMRKKRKEKLLMVMFDVDDFKKINDTYGHIKGDEVIKHVSELLKVSLDENDICARFGGDEFMLLFKNIQRLEIARIKCDTIVERIRETNILGDSKVQASIGAVLSSSKDLDKLMKIADENLYEIKRNGKNKALVTEYSEK